MRPRQIENTQRLSTVVSTGGSSGARKPRSSRGAPGGSLDAPNRRPGELQGSEPASSGDRSAGAAGAPRLDTEHSDDADDDPDAQPLQPAAAPKPAHQPEAAPAPLPSARRVKVQLSDEDAGDAHARQEVTLGGS